MLGVSRIARPLTSRGVRKRLGRMRRSRLRRPGCASRRVGRAISPASVIGAGSRRVGGTHLVAWPAHWGAKAVRPLWTDYRLGDAGRWREFRQIGGLGPAGTVQPVQLVLAGSHL